jgi:hypothetical protein
MFDRNQRAWAARLAERGNAVPRDDAHSPANRRPRPGDIIITRSAPRHHGRYTIGRFHKHPQLSCPSREKALSIARASASGLDVEIWEEDAGTFTSIVPRGRRED